MIAPRGWCWGGRRASSKGSQDTSSARRRSSRRAASASNSVRRAVLGAVMRLSHPLVAAAALALLVAPACTPVRAEAPWGAPDDGYASGEPYEPEDAPDPDQYRDELAPYGEWQDVPQYGVVWRPTYM